MNLERATLEDYLNSIEQDGSMTDHDRRVAAQLFNRDYTHVTSQRELHAGKIAWRKMLNGLQWGRS
jgi:hypothetical protein